MTLRLVRGFSLTFCFPGLLRSDDLGYKTKSKKNNSSFTFTFYKRGTDKTVFFAGSHEIMKTGGAGCVAEVVMTFALSASSHISQINKSF